MTRPACAVELGMRGRLGCVVGVETGRLNLTVSHEHINLWVTNDLKDLRERRYADEFLFMLHQSGAQVVTG